MKKLILLILLLSIDSFAVTSWTRTIWERGMGYSRSQAQRDAEGKARMAARRLEQRCYYDHGRFSHGPLYANNCRPIGSRWQCEVRARARCDIPQ